MSRPHSLVCSTYCFCFFSFLSEGEDLHHFSTLSAIRFLLRGSQISLFPISFWFSAEAIVAHLSPPLPLIFPRASLEIPSYLLIQPFPFCVPLLFAFVQSGLPCRLLLQSSLVSLNLWVHFPKFPSFPRLSSMAMVSPPRSSSPSLSYFLIGFLRFADIIVASAKFFG